MLLDTKQSLMEVKQHVTVTKENNNILKHEAQDFIDNFTFHEPKPAYDIVFNVRRRIK